MRTLSSRLLMGVIIASTISACSSPASPESAIEDPWGTVVVEAGEPVRIALVLSMVGSGADREATEQLRGVEMAVQEHGALLGHTIEIVPYESQCAETESLEAAQSAISDPTVVAVIGPSCSTACIATAAVFEQANFTAVSPACSAANLTDQVTHRDAFMRTIYSDTLEAEASARFAYLQLGARRVAIIHDGTPETADLATGFEAVYGSMGGEVVLSEAIEQGDENVLPVLTAARELRPDLIYAPLLAEDAIRLVVERDRADWQDVALLGGRHYWSTWFLEETADIAQNIYASGPYLNIEAFREAEARYVELYGEPPGSALFAYAYDAANLVFSAIERSGVVTAGNELIIGRQALRSELYDTATFGGATGALTCTAWGECSRPIVAIAQVQDNQWVVVYIP